MTFGTPGPEHEWLHQIVGEWRYVYDSKMGPDKPNEQFTGTETVRSVGGLWIIGESKGQMPGGGDAVMVFTTGYDPAIGKYVGTWLGSMMTKLWVYDISREGNTLNMDSIGPAFDDPTRTVRYRDAMEIRSRDYRVFSASVMGDDGKWTTFMSAEYHRVK